jgi:hypothetical protein
VRRSSADDAGARQDTRAERGSRTGPRRRSQSSAASGVPGIARRSQASVGSGRQFAATLGPAGGDDGATGTGAHAQPEPVLLGPSTVVRLEGALAHGRTLSYRRSARPCGGHAGVTCSQQERRTGTTLVRTYTDRGPRYGSGHTQVKLAKRRIVHPRTPDRQLYDDTPTSIAAPLRRC